MGGGGGGERGKRGLYQWCTQQGKGWSGAGGSRWEREGVVPVVFSARCLYDLNVVTLVLFSIADRLTSNHGDNHHNHTSTAH